MGFYLWRGLISGQLKNVQYSERPIERIEFPLWMCWNIEFIVNQVPLDVMNGKYKYKVKFYRCGIFCSTLDWIYLVLLKCYISYGPSFIFQSSVGMRKLLHGVSWMLLMKSRSVNTLTEFKLPWIILLCIKQQAKLYIRLCMKIVGLISTMNGLIVIIYVELVSYSSTCLQ